MHVQMFSAAAVSALVNRHKQLCCSLVNQQVNKTQALWTPAKQNGICMLTNGDNTGETRKRDRRQTRKAIVHSTILEGSQSCTWLKTLEALQSPPVHEGWAWVGLHKKKKQAGGTLIATSFKNERMSCRQPVLDVWVAVPSTTVQKP